MGGLRGHLAIVFMSASNWLRIGRLVGIKMFDMVLICLVQIVDRCFRFIFGFFCDRKSDTRIGQTITKY